MRNIDVQLKPNGAVLKAWHPNVPLSIGLTEMRLDSDEFDLMAEQFAEAVLNKNGYEKVTCLAEEAKIGWRMGEFELINVRPFYKGDPGMTAINLKASPGFLLIASDTIMEFARPIQ